MRDNRTENSFLPSFALPPREGEASLGRIFADAVEAAVNGHSDDLRNVANLFFDSYVGEDRSILRKRVTAAFRPKTKALDQLRSVERLPVDNKSRVPLVEEQPWPTMPLILSDEHDQILRRFVIESEHSERLAEADLSLRSNLLLSGPPGTGKSFIAGHVAARLGLPFYVVRLDAVVSSLLGDTAKNIRALFEFANHGPKFLFLDEMDSVAKKRDDQRELGEIKRVVNTLIQGLDSIDEKTVIIGATNHAHLLDPAIFRRFPYAIEMDFPDQKMREALWNIYLKSEDSLECDSLATVSSGLSGSDIRDLATAARRTAVLQQSTVDMAALTWAVQASSTSNLKLPPIDGLSHDARRTLNASLAEIPELTYREIGALTGVSKQAAMRMAKSQAKPK